MKWSLFSKLFLVSCFWVIYASAQQNNVWCFGDSAGINFNNGSIPFPISTALRSRGTSVSISDTSGNLLFYGNTRSGVGSPFSGYSGQVWNKNHSLMINGDSLTAGGWYYEMVITPDPSEDSLYYLFTIGVTHSFGITYSKIDMRGDNGLGEVVQKNISLLSNIRMVDCLLAVKHGNGRDWWVIARESPVQFPSTNNTWYVFLISPSGISNIGVQNMGTLNGTNSGRLAYDTASNRICFVNSLYLIELYDFDRCSGTILNSTNVVPQSYSQPADWNWSCEFSPSGQFLYISTWINGDSSYLWQYDTWATNITASKTLIWKTNYPVYYVIGQLKRAPDNKIYLSNGWVDTTGFYNFPYLSNQYFPENMNLSVINTPDSAGLLCDFQPYSYYLGGKRTYWGLPNNPDYDLEALSGSLCDSLTTISDITIISEAQLFVYYDINWQSAFINANKLEGKSYSLEVFDLLGKSVFNESGILSPSYFTKNLNCIGFSKGMYIVNFVTDKERLVKRFIIK